MYRGRFDVPWYELYEGWLIAGVVVILAVVGLLN